MKDWPTWMHDPVETWRDKEVLEFLRNHKCPLQVIDLDSFIAWVEAEYPEAYSFIAMMRFWRNKYISETTRST